MTMETRTIFADAQYRIRTLAASDAANLHAAVQASLPALSTWLSWCTGAYGLSDSEQFISRCASNLRDDVRYDFCVFDAATDAVLGAIAINAINRKESCANISYWTRTGSTHRGIATLSARAAAIFGFQKLELTRLEILAQTTNHASRRVAEKLGACFEEIDHNKFLFRGEPRAVAVYSLRPGDIHG
jgi:RimJ/RimL family protein N-acetyltransferase